MKYIVHQLYILCSYMCHLKYWELSPVSVYCETREWDAVTPDLWPGPVRRLHSAIAHLDTWPFVIGIGSQATWS